MARSRRFPTSFTLAHGLMVLAGLATFVTVGSVLAERDAMTTVLVTARPARAGTPVVEIATQPHSVPADTPFLSELATIEDLGPGRALARELGAGDPIFVWDLVPTGSGNLTRTATVEVDSFVIGGLGLVVGDRIDVIGVDASATGTPGARARSFVVADVRISRLPETGGVDALRFGAVAAFVTVEVSDVQALALAQARAAGPLDIVRATGAVALTPEVRP